MERMVSKIKWNSTDEEIITSGRYLVIVHEKEVKEDGEIVVPESIGIEIANVYRDSKIMEMEIFDDGGSWTIRGWTGDGIEVLAWAELPDVPLTVNGEKLDEYHNDTLVCESHKTLRG